MVEESKAQKKKMPQDLASRFRSKEDLYRYLTQQGNLMLYHFCYQQWTCSFHHYMGPRSALWETSSVKQRCFSDKMRLIAWKCRATKRSRSRICMPMRWTMSCLWSTFQQRSNCLADFQRETSSSGWCALWGASIWRTLSQKLIRRGSLFQTMIQRKRVSLSPKHG